MTTKTTKNMAISTAAIARAFALAKAHGHGWAAERPQWAWRLVSAGMPSQLVAEWTRAAVLAENAATRAAEPSATAADAAYEAAQAAQAERAWTAVQVWAANAAQDSVIVARDAMAHRAPRTVAEALAANALAEAEDDLLGNIAGLRWTPDAHGDVRHVTCTGATEWYVRSDGLVRIRRRDTRDDRVAVVASATIRADGQWRAEVSAEASEPDLTRLCECVEAALGLPQGAATRGVMLGCDPYDLRRRAERGDERAASALLPLPLAGADLSGAPAAKAKAR